MKKSFSVVLSSKFSSIFLAANVVGLFAASALPAHASYFDNDVTALESAEAIIHCTEEAKQLLSDSSVYLVSVTAKHEEVSKKIDKKRYTFATASAGYFGGPPAVEGPSLYVDLILTQDDHEGPAVQKWNCTLSTGQSSSSSSSSFSPTTTTTTSK